MNGAAFQRDEDFIAECNMKRGEKDAACVDIKTDGRDGQMARLVRLQDYLRVN
jgi:hypothetical protein